MHIGTDYCNGLGIYLIIILLVRYSQLASNTYSVIFTVYALDFFIKYETEDINHDLQHIVKLLIGF